MTGILGGGWCGVCKNGAKPVSKFKFENQKNLDIPLIFILIMKWSFFTKFSNPLKLNQTGFNFGTIIQY